MITGSRPLSAAAGSPLNCVKRRLLVAARDLLVERGSAVTLSEIARHAGLDQPAAAPGPLDPPGPSGSPGPPAPLDVFLAHRLQELLELVPASQESEGADADAPSWLRDLRAALPARLADRSSSLRQVSADLAVSPRTLQRWLSNAGTSWRAEVETARRRLATELARAGEGRKGVARKIGYSDPRALRRAWRRWDRAAGM